MNNNVTALAVGDVFECPEPPIRREFGNPLKRYRILQVNHDSVLIRKEYAWKKQEHIRVAIPGCWPAGGDMPVLPMRVAYTTLYGNGLDTAEYKRFLIAIEALAPPHVSDNYREQARLAAKTCLQTLPEPRSLSDEEFAEDCRFVAEASDELWDKAIPTVFDCEPWATTAVAHRMQIRR